MGAKKQIVISTVPLNGARNASDPSIVDNTPREVILDEETMSLRIEGPDGVEFELIGSGAAFIGTVDFNDINALAAANKGQIVFDEALPAFGVPQNVTAIIDIPFAYELNNFGFDIGIQIINPITGLVELLENITWNIVSTVEGGTILVANFDTKVFAVSETGLNIIVELSFFDIITGQPANNPKNLTEGQARFYGRFTNSTL